MNLLYKERFLACRTAQAAPISMGSPRAVPVPCISRAASIAGAMPAEASAARITSCWEGPLGAVRLLERPSCMHSPHSPSHPILFHQTLDTIEQESSRFVAQSRVDGIKYIKL